MKRTAQDILNFVEDNDVKFAKLTFCDIFGNQKKSVFSFFHYFCKNKTMYLHILFCQH